MRLGAQDNISLRNTVTHKSLFHRYLFGTSQEIKFGQGLCKKSFAACGGKILF